MQNCTANRFAIEQMFEARDPSFQSGEAMQVASLVKTPLQRLDEPAILHCTVIERGRIPFQNILREFT